MPIQPVLINGSWREPKSPIGHFQSITPETGVAQAERYPISSFTDIELALSASYWAVKELKSVSPENIAKFLELYASNIEAHAALLSQTAAIETALPEKSRFLDIELPRTTDQLRKAARAAKDRSWGRATIDTKANIRSKFSPLGGPVVIFGPNNFPFAFNSISGGDFAAAIASGNPVIAKANPGHPGTTRIFAEVALKALKKCGLPLTMIQLIYHLQPEDGFKLVSHPLTGATAFTGSRKSGLALKHAAESAGKLIYIEMSGLNPVFIFPLALKERGKEIAEELSKSCTLGAGQFCTNPGLVVLLKNQDTENFIKILAEKLRSTPASILLSRQVLQSLAAAVSSLKIFGAEIVSGGKKIDTKAFSFANTLLRVTGDKFLKKSKKLQTEAFGPSSLIVVAENIKQMITIATHLEGNLTGSIYSHTDKKEESLYAEIEAILRTKVGRLINDKMPTGVAVSPAMSHGGPFPATGHPGFTSVGIPAAMLRFSALHCYDNVRKHRLPAELKDKNPYGKMWRLIDGDWTQKNI